jgi:hypothetical protein
MPNLNKRRPIAHPKLWAVGALLVWFCVTYFLSTIGGLVVAAILMFALMLYVGSSDKNEHTN